MTNEVNTMIDGEYRPSRKKQNRDYKLKRLKNRTIFVVKVNGKRGYFKRRQRGYGGRYVFTLVKNDAMTSTFAEILNVKRTFERQEHNKKVEIVKRLGANDIYKNRAKSRDKAKRAETRLENFKRELKYYQRKLEDFDRKRQQYLNNIALYSKKVKTANATLNPQFDSKIGSLF